MRLIVNEIFELENFDSARLVKYMRCIFQAVLPTDDGLALQLLDQALQLAREGAQVCSRARVLARPRAGPRHPCKRRACLR